VTRLMSPGDVADRLGVSVRTVTRLVDERRIDSTRVGRLNRIPETAVEEYIKANTRPAKGDDVAHIDRTIGKIRQNRDERTTAEKIADLRTELHEIYKRAQQGQDTPRDSKRADDIAHQIRELQS
jgi:excisionase family DNA binding protein